MISGNAAVQSNARGEYSMPPLAGLIRLLPTRRLASKLCSALPRLAVFNHRESFEISMLSSLMSTPYRLPFKMSRSISKISNVPVMACVSSLTRLYSASSRSNAATRKAPEPHAGSHTLMSISASRQASRNRYSTSRSEPIFLFLYAAFSSLVGSR